MKLEEADAFILQEREMFLTFVYVSNIMIEITVLRKAKFISGRSHI